MVCAVGAGRPAGHLNSGDRRLGARAQLCILLCFGFASGTAGQDAVFLGAGRLVPPRLLQGQLVRGPTGWGAPGQDGLPLPRVRRIRVGRPGVPACWRRGGGGVVWRGGGFWQALAGRRGGGWHARASSLRLRRPPPWEAAQESLGRCPFACAPPGTHTPAPVPGETFRASPLSLSTRGSRACRLGNRGQGVAELLKKWPLELSSGSFGLFWPLEDRKSVV